MFALLVQRFVAVSTCAVLAFSTRFSLGLRLQPGQPQALEKSSDFLDAVEDLHDEPVPEEPRSSKMLRDSTTASGVCKSSSCSTMTTTSPTSASCSDPHSPAGACTSMTSMLPPNTPGGASSSGSSWTQTYEIGTPTQRVIDATPPVVDMSSDLAKISPEDCPVCPGGMGLFHQMEPRKVGDMPPGNQKVYCNHCALVLKKEDPYMATGTTYFHCPYEECDYDVCTECAKIGVATRMHGSHEMAAINEGLESMQHRVASDWVALGNALSSMFVSEKVPDRARIPMLKASAASMSAEEWTAEQHRLAEMRKAKRDAKNANGGLGMGKEKEA
ncbi:unnamed protein product [Amoebophrya sp. A120]|nr:unnamed protein product [Amoebophrya sp. A120]|eukprot:GSA120T00010772001.1